MGNKDTGRRSNGLDGERESGDVAGRKGQDRVENARIVYYTPFN